MAVWHDVMRLFKKAFRADPLSKGKVDRADSQAGYTDPSSLLDIRASSGGLGGGGSVRLRDSNDFIDLSTVSNRVSRYREYDRLRTMPEIEMAMTVFADEACQKNEDGKIFQVSCDNDDVKEELEDLFFNRDRLNLDQKKLWNRAKNLFINGDDFLELVLDVSSPKSGVLGISPLPPDSMYRIETTKGKLVEFQQSKEGPDYNSLARVEVTKATDADLQQATAIRFAPEQIVHIKIGDDRRTFYPYGVSLIEAARGPAHQLRLLED